MTAGAKTPRHGRPYVALHTKTLNDPDFMDLTVAAKWTYIALLLHTAEQGNCGFVPANPRHVQRIVELDAVTDTAAAVEELLAGRFLIEDTDDATRLYIRTWDKYQAELGDARPGPKPGSSAAQTSALLRHHRDGKHAEPREGCPSCAEGAVADTATPRGPDVVADTLPIDVPAPVQGPKKSGMSEVLADLVTSLDETIPAFDTPFQGYVAALGEVDELAPSVAHLSKDARSSLRNSVLAHALRTYLGDVATQTVINTANRGAKSLGHDGHLWYLHAVAKAAGRVFETEGKCIGWLKTVATSTRSEQKAAA